MQKRRRDRVNHSSPAFLLAGCRPGICIWDFSHAAQPLWQAAAAGELVESACKWLIQQRFKGADLTAPQ